MKDFNPAIASGMYHGMNLAASKEFDDRVHVRFDNPTPRGAVSKGEYDELWFSNYPRGLQIVSRDAAE